ncbi:MAG TPA: HDIG domain-containing protein, partial [Candidatus Limnocylindrales bacterium]|nr:HDIG domain-containing protein [Candidatus Limnocylindrales bacterium]
AFAAVLTDQARRDALAAALPELSEQATTTLQSLSGAEWQSLKTEMERVLDAAQRQEVRDTELPAAQAALVDRLPAGLAADRRALAGEILPPLLVANSSYDEAATVAEAEARANAVPPVVYEIQRGEVIVEGGHRITATDLEKLEALGLLDQEPDAIRVGGWLLLSILSVGLLLSWIWRFRSDFWHRDNALLLVGLVLVLATVALKVTGERPVLPFIVPTAAAALLIAVLLDAGAAIVVTAVIAMLAAVIGGVQLGVFVFMGSFAGVIAVRRGERPGHFIQAALAMVVVNVLVVSTFALLGEVDLAGLLELMGASLLAAGGSALAAYGSFTILGSLFGITTSYTLLELANPSQPLLRRLLLETSGTYHHSLMVGNLAERAAEAIGADPLLARVAAYYHDVGKLANPLAFIENQGGMDNIHDELGPEQSAAMLKSHVARGIDIAYSYRLPKAIIAFIPQHHGTALMSYFYAKASEAAGGPAPIDQARFRHAGPKPQTREAALLMLADSIEASVRSLTSHEEPAIRGMVDRIIRERLEDGQFDECDLTLRDLELTREAFVAQLLGMYHRRIEYPQNKIVELESRRTAGSGGASA